MPTKLKNPFKKTSKKHKKIMHHRKPLLSSDERKRLTLYKKLKSDERKAADIRLGNSLKGSFEKFLATQRRRPSSKKKRRKTKKKKSDSKK